MLTTFFGHWNYWNLKDKVTFDGDNKLIIINSNVAEIDIKSDVYSAWKRWKRLRDSGKYEQAIRTIGGDPTVNALKAGDIYFLINGWRLQVDLAVTSISGSLFSDDFTTPLVTLEGLPAYQSFVSNLVTGVESSGGSGGSTPQQVWEYANRSLTSPTGVQQEDIDAIAAAVWASVSRTLTETGNIATADVNAIRDAVWLAASRTLTDPSGVTAQDITDIADAIWNKVV